MVPAAEGRRGPRGAPRGCMLLQLNPPLLDTMACMDDDAKKPGTRRTLQAAAAVAKGVAILGAAGAVVAVVTMVSLVSAIPTSVILGGAATIYGVKVLGGAAMRSWRSSEK